MNSSGDKEASAGDKDELRRPNRYCDNPSVPNYLRASTSRLVDKEASTGDKEVLHHQNRNRNGPFVPTYSRAGTSGLPLPAKYLRRPASDKSKRRDNPLHIPFAEPIKLHQSENAWKPLHKIEWSPEDLEREKLKRNVQCVLNKLTFQKFKILLAQLKKLNIYTENGMDIVADLIYENAISEPHFSVLYANLCNCLAMANMSVTEHPEEKVDFSTLLLTKCQKEFEEYCSSPNQEEFKVLDVDNTEREDQQLNSEEENKVRARRAGNIRFIGELFKLKMILKPVLHECIEILLMKQDEESLEYLCLLIKTAGKELENHDGCSEIQNTDEYFTQIQKIVNERSTSTRIRFLLQDILDLKENKWIPRRTENIPRTIDEIHKEAALEARKQWRWYQNMLLLATQHEKPDQRNSPACHDTCMCEGKVTTSTKSKKGSSRVLNQAGSNIDTLDEVKNILLAEGRRGQKKPVKDRSKQKNSQKLRK